MEGLSVVDHDAVGDHSGVVIPHSLISFNPCYWVLSGRLRDFLLPELADVMLLDDVAVATLLDGEDLVVVCVDSPEYVACLLVESDDCLVSLTVVVDIPTRLHLGAKVELRAEDLDVLPGEDQLRVDADRGAGKEGGVGAAEFDRVFLNCSRHGSK